MSVTIATSDSVIRLTLRPTLSDETHPRMSPVVSATLIVNHSSSVGIKFGGP